MSMWHSVLNVLFVGYANAAGGMNGQPYRPGDTVSGVSGEFFRYSNIFVKMPDDSDREYSFISLE